MEYTVNLAINDLAYVALSVLEGHMTQGNPFHLTFII